MLNKPGWNVSFGLVLCEVRDVRLHRNPNIGSNCAYCCVTLAMSATILNSADSVFCPIAMFTPVFVRFVASGRGRAESLEKRLQI